MLEIKKRDKRLVIADGDDIIYTPPEFIRKKIYSKKDMDIIIEKLNEGVPRIDVVWCFEKQIADRV